METIETLDVTIIEPKLKHPTIFQKFDTLIEGGAFIIHNDHDPKPLYYQLIGERGNIFTWEYLTSGPEHWEVKIKKKDSTLEATIGELVAKDFRKAEIFKKYNLDFCCGGKKTVTQACAVKKVDYLAVEKELNSIDLVNKTLSHNFDEWSLEFLVDYILNTHHEYVKKSIPVLLGYTSKVAKVHGGHHPEVIAIAQKFDEAAEELNEHMCKEEQILFPYIKQLVLAKSNNLKTPYTAFGSVKNPIHMMEHEHDAVGDIFKEIRELSNNYTPPEDSCATYKVSYLKLKEFEEDLHQHIHLENNILFPKSISIESQL
ncbi:MAG: iron-sulfur cluster repair di-iron protein [Sphingobacteriaceae bacterium]|nr:iron-sulfur cluster repair di-iron protein [Sphingobacteriaceae bacterium]